MLPLSYDIKIVIILCQKSIKYLSWSTVTQLKKIDKVLLRLAHPEYLFDSLTSYPSPVDLFPRSLYLVPYKLRQAKVQKNFYKNSFRLFDILRMSTIQKDIIHYYIIQILQTLL